LAREERGRERERRSASQSGEKTKTTFWVVGGKKNGRPGEKSTRPVIFLPDPTRRRCTHRPPYETAHSPTNPHPNPQPISLLMLSRDFIIINIFRFKIINKKKTRLGFPKVYMLGQSNTENG